MHVPFTRRSVVAGGAVALAATPLGVRAAAEPLLRRAIPHGTETIPVVGVGSWQVFDVGGDAAKRKAVAEVIATLVDGGGSLVDTASSYGTSEEVIGAVAAGTPLREKLFLATKLEEGVGAAAREEFATSLKRLKVRSVDLLMLHNVDEGDLDLAFFRELQREGLTRYVGATTSFKDGYAAMEAMIRRDKPDFVEIDCSIADREAEKRIIPAAAEVGAAVVIALPFDGAMLFQKVKGKPLPPNAAEIGAATWGQVFLKFLLGNPAVTAVIPGTSNPAHVTDNLAAGCGPMPDAKQRAALIDYFEGLG